MTDALHDAIRSARISTAMRGLHPELVSVLEPADWPEVLARLQAIYRRVTNQPNAVLSVEPALRSLQAGAQN